MEGMNEEMTKRLARVTKWDEQIDVDSAEAQKFEKIMFDTQKSEKERVEAGRKLADLKCRIRELAEKKTLLAERNHRTVQAVYTKLNELAYHCKCELETDNPGSTEQRERVFYQTLDKNYRGEYQSSIPNVRTTNSGRQRTREYSVMTDDDRASTSSGTLFTKREKSSLKKGPGRPRNAFKMAHFDRFPVDSNASSARSSMEPSECGGSQNTKKLSKYMKKKNEKMRKEEQKLSKFDVKREVDTGDYESFALNQWNNDDDMGMTSSKMMNGSSLMELCEEEEAELLDCFAGLPSPPRGMMDVLDVTESDVCGMDLYPKDHKSENYDDFRHPGASAMSSQSFTHKRANNAARAPPAVATAAAVSSFSDSTIIRYEKQRSHTPPQRNTLFGSISDTSFSGRPRKLTDRVTEMIISNRERTKKYREQEEWCICNGMNINSGMMVECENKNCPIKWFHFECVGLLAAPLDEWYCTDCNPFH
ncbi:PHD-type domain-containing protein [Caenorhabditis elegans]|nr:PHD-type domain-containing protein [Caenorhabditis elegans]CTQ86539.1 PHD-type domain-containing protein [Caenorhabditis elegans]|eukprot:NP_001300600.1 Uncharacterized protein CELE_Y43H11AL.1 [Caenorhabditis elegans]